MKSNLATRMVIIPAAVVTAAVGLAVPADADVARTTAGASAAGTSATTGTSVTASASATAGASAAAGSIPGRYCGQARGSGGYVRQAAPWKSGAYLRVSSIVHCGRADVWNFRSVETHISQYRGLGIWRAKARKITRKNGRGAYTVTHNLSWKCSGGSQLYRNATFNRVGKWLYKSYSGQRRFRC